MSSDVAHTFDAESYLEDGFLKPVVDHTDLLQIEKNVETTMTKSISLTNVNFFTNPWLDSSAVALISMGEEFEFYQVERSTLNKASDSKNPRFKPGQYTIFYDQARQVYTEDWAI